MDLTTHVDPAGSTPGETSRCTLGKPLASRDMMNYGQISYSRLSERSIALGLCQVNRARLLCAPWPLRYKREDGGRNDNAL